MVKTKASKLNNGNTDEAVTMDPAEAETVSPNQAESSTEPKSDDVDADQLDLDTVFSALKTLLSTVEKLQKSRQEVGDIKPLIIRMLDGEILSGDELDRLKSGVKGFSSMVKIYGDYQVALEKAQPARNILDTILKP